MILIFPFPRLKLGANHLIGSSRGKPSTQASIPKIICPWLQGIKKASDLSEAFVRVIGGQSTIN
jgi:hypothetical protein